MANNQNADKSVNRLEGVLALFSKEPVTQAFLLSCSKTDFISILQKRAFLVSRNFGLLGIAILLLQTSRRKRLLRTKS